MRADRAFTSVQRAIGTPQREATALVAGVRAAVGALRGARQARRRRSGFDEDDALFIGWGAWPTLTAAGASGKHYARCREVDPPDPALREAP